MAAFLCYLVPPTTTPHSVVCALDSEQLRCGCEVSGVTFELTVQKQIPGGVCRYIAHTYVHTYIPTYVHNI